MTVVNVPQNLGGDGLPFSDGGESARDMGGASGQGYATHFFPLIAQLVAAGNTMVGLAQSALNAPGTSATSTTSLTFGGGDQSLSIQAGKALSPGQRIVIASTVNPAQQMSGPIKSYDASTGALVVTVDEVYGAGTLAVWSVGLQGKSGAAGLSGRVEISAAATLDAMHRNTLVDITGAASFTLGFAAAAALGNGWNTVVRVGGDGDITYNPDGSETIDGLTSFIGYPGSVRWIVCDGTALYSIPLVGGTKTFSSTGNYVWAPGIAQWAFDLMGAGAGGGGGARSTTRYNGGGGGAGERYKGTLWREQVIAGASVMCSVGAGGMGGPAATTDNSPANNYTLAGTGGGHSTLGSLVTAHGGMSTATGGYTSAHGLGASGGGAGTQTASNLAYVTGQANATYLQTSGTYTTEWGGSTGRHGIDVATSGVLATLGGQRSGGVAGVSGNAGVDGQDGTNPGDGGYGGSGALNGYTAGKGGNGAGGYIKITEII